MCSAQQGTPFQRAYQRPKRTVPAQPPAGVTSITTTVTRVKNAVPVPLVVALSLVAVEGLVMLLLAVLELFALDSTRLAMGLTTTVFFAGYGVGLLLCARGMWQGSSWGRSPVVLAQLIQLGVAWSWFAGSTRTLAVGLAVVALVVLVGVFHPASLAALEDEA